MRIEFGAAAMAALALAGAADAQTPLKPGTPRILAWTQQQQSDGYRSIETLFKVAIVKRGKKVHPLPMAARQIAPTFSYGGRTFTVDDYMAAYRVSGLLAIKDGRIVLERYAMGRKPSDRWTSFSVAKSVTSTLVGAAIADGKIAGLGAPVTAYIPELKGSAYDGVTVRQLLMMSSGVKWNEDYTDPKSDVASWTPPLVTYMSRLPRAAEPGTTFNYNTGETDLVGVLVARAVGRPLAQYASEKIWKPYGMERDAIWMTDPDGQERGGCCMSMTLRDYGRVGQFILDGGRAAGRRVLPDWWVAEATRKQIDDGYSGYGYFWWIRPNGSFEAAGIFGQSIAVFRDDRLVIVMNSAWPQATGRELSAARMALQDAIREAAKTN